MDEVLKKLEAIEKRLENIENSINRVEEKIDNINNRLDGIEMNTNMMGNHIYFVEDVYDKVKKPFYYIFNSINKMINNPVSIIEFEKNN